jgi:hypothetical protein
MPARLSRVLGCPTDPTTTAQTDPSCSRNLLCWYQHSSKVRVAWHQKILLPVGVADESNVDLAFREHLQASAYCVTMR